MRLALYEPDIPQNAGTIMRLAACMGVPVEIIEPCGFTLSDRRFRRAGMDYLDHLDLTVFIFTNCKYMLHNVPLHGASNCCILSLYMVQVLAAYFPLHDASTCCILSLYMV